MSPTEVVTPEQLLHALEVQSRMPILRIGQALMALGAVTEEQLREGLAQQQLDRSVPLGETLVRMGVVTREQLKAALVRKMGYPLVNLHLFPVAVDALRTISHGVARRLQVMPLMIHQGRLILAMDDPASRHAAIDEVEFISQMKVVPVIGECLVLDTVLYKAYGKIGNDTILDPTIVHDPSRPLEIVPGPTIKHQVTHQKYPPTTNLE